MANSFDFGFGGTASSGTFTNYAGIYQYVTAPTGNLDINGSRPVSYTSAVIREGAYSGTSASAIYYNGTTFNVDRTGSTLYFTRYVGDGNKVYDKGDNSAWGSSTGNWGGLHGTISWYTVPAQISTVNASLSGTTSVALSWTVPDGGGGGVSSYKIYNVNTNEIKTSTTNSFTWTGLTSGISYRFQVSAVNAAGTAQKSPQSAAIYIPIPAPVISSAAPTNGISKSITLSWSAVTGYSSYNIYYTKIGTSTRSLLGNTINNALTFSGDTTKLEENVQYSLEVAGTASGNESAYSTPKSSYASGKPNPPRNLVLSPVQSATDSLNVAFSAPSPITGNYPENTSYAYMVYYYATNNPSTIFQKFISATTNATVSTTLTSLTPGNAYSAYVVASSTAIAVPSLPSNIATAITYSPITWQVTPSSYMVNQNAFFSYGYAASPDQLISVSYSTTSTLPPGIKLIQSLTVKLASTNNVARSGLSIPIDGVALTAGDRVLLKNQTNASENGIYVVASGSWTRATDADTAAELPYGLPIYVTAGTVNSGTAWKLTTTSTITLNTTALSFESIYSTQMINSGSLFSIAGIPTKPGFFPITVIATYTDNAQQKTITSQINIVVAGYGKRKFSSSFVKNIVTGKRLVDLGNWSKAESVGQPVNTKSAYRSSSGVTRTIKTISDHGLTNGDTIYVSGINDQLNQYNSSSISNVDEKFKTFTVTVIDPKTFSYVGKYYQLDSLSESQVADSGGTFWIISSWKNINGIKVRKAISSVSRSSSGTTRIINTASAHGLSIGDSIYISGMGRSEYNSSSLSNYDADLRLFQITAVTAQSFTYTGNSSLTESSTSDSGGIFWVSVA